MYDPRKDCSICIIRVGLGSLALGNLCIPLVLFTVFVYLTFLLSHKMCYLSLVLSSFLDVPSLQIYFLVSVGA